ncbi:MAG TPA: hypothetical protein VMS76_01850, partial [Planctomycetota bacterium]|nr:hypothetical protein [Planctomycetota bacterium]
PYYRGAAVGTGGTASINVVDKIDLVRQDDPITGDIRVEKEFAATRDVNLTFGIDVFNVTNEGTGLYYRANCGSTNVASTCGHLADNISPRIYRLGLRLGWK